MLNAGLLERRGLDGEACVLVQRDGLELRGQAYLRAALLARGAQREREHPQGDTAAAPLALHRHAADFRAVCVESSRSVPITSRPSGASATRCSACSSSRVDLLLARHALLVAEHALPERERAAHVLATARPADLDLAIVHRR